MPKKLIKIENVNVDGGNSAQNTPRAKKRKSGGELNASGSSQKRIKTEIKREVAE
jgi:hypothetical protein